MPSIKIVVARIQDARDFADDSRHFKSLTHAQYDHTSLSTLAASLHKCPVVNPGLALLLSDVHRTLNNVREVCIEPVFLMRIS